MQFWPRDAGTSRKMAKFCANRMVTRMPRKQACAGIARCLSVDCEISKFFEDCGQRRFAEL